MTSNLDSYRAKLDEKKKEYNIEKGKALQISSLIKSEGEKLEDITKKLGGLKKSLEVLMKGAEISRDNAKVILESTVTSALQYITGEAYKFIIEFGTLRGKPSCEFYIVSEVNGVESKQNPLEACGGGFVDIISNVLRYAYINILSDPIILNAVISDEPGKMISESAGVKFSEFIKDLGDTFNRQTIMVTHNQNFASTADKLIEIQKIGDGSVVNNNFMI